LAESGKTLSSAKRYDSTRPEADVHYLAAGALQQQRTELFDAAIAENPALASP